MSTQIRFAISTHVNYCALTIPHLLESLVTLNGVLPETILVAVGGSDKEYTEIREGVEWRYVTHNSFDHTALIAVTEANLDADWWCYLHDTCEAGARFLEILTSILTSPAAEHYQNFSMESEGWMNIGAMSRAGLVEMKNYILCMKNCDKIRAMRSEKLYHRMLRSTCFCTPAQRIEKGRAFPYGTQISRLVVFLEGIDLIKYQANSDIHHYGFNIP